jgi:hypothetical protein
LIQKTRNLLKIWILAFEKGAVVPVGAVLALLEQSDSDPSNSLQRCGLRLPTYRDSNYPFEPDIGWF